MPSPMKYFSMLFLDQSCMYQNSDSPFIRWRKFSKYFHGVIFQNTLLVWIGEEVVNGVELLRIIWMQQMNLMGRIILINYIWQNIRDGFIWNKKKRNVNFHICCTAPSRKKYCEWHNFFSIHSMSHPFMPKSLLLKILKLKIWFY